MSVFPFVRATSCMDCMFRREFSCRAASPKVIVVNDSNGVGMIETVWPNIDPSQWCGEGFKPVAQVEP